MHASMHALHACSMHAIVWKGIVTIGKYKKLFTELPIRVYGIGTVCGK
jgi:hypothetical protein